jgi:hypothetical protein
MLVPRQSCNRVRSQNSIWRGGFHRCEYREAIRPRQAIPSPQVVLLRATSKSRARRCLRSQYLMVEGVTHFSCSKMLHLTYSFQAVGC